jgi:hypothetical protein
MSFVMPNETVQKLILRAKDVVSGGALTPPGRVIVEPEAF